MSEPKGGEVILFQRDGAPTIDVRLVSDTVWLSLNQLADLPGRDKSTISRHISNVFAEEELERSSVVAEFATTATAVFFKTVQNKLHYAAHGQTAAEVIAVRADAGKPFMGLLSFSGKQPTKAEIGVAKNYLDENEIKRLNALVSAYFDAAEFRAMNHNPTHMKDWLSHLQQLIEAMGGKSLDGAGNVSQRQAMAKAATEYFKYRGRLSGHPSEVETAYLETVKAAQKKITTREKT